MNNSKRNNGVKMKRPPTNLPPPLSLIWSFWFVLAVASCLFGSHGDAAVTTWKGGGANVNWNIAANWVNGVPTTSGDVVFNNTGVVLNTGFNNVVSANTTIQSLNYSHTNPYNGTQTYHNTHVNDGVTLTVSNASTMDAVFVGSGLSLPSSATRASISGANASLVVLATNGFLNVRQGGSQNYSGMATLDLSGLGNLTIRAQRILVAGDGTNGDVKRDRASGGLKLARTSLLYLGPNYPVGLSIGQSIGNGGLGGSLELGQTNYIFADYGMGVGLGKSSACSVWFGVYPNAYAQFRNSSGTDRQINWLIGDCAAVKYTGNTNSATVDFSGGTVDALLNVLVVGRSVNDDKGLELGGSDGTLSLDAGTIDTDSAIVGYQMSNYCARAQGTVNVDGTGEFTVNHFLHLGRFQGAAASNGVSFAKLNIGTRAGGGTVSVGGNIFTLVSPLNPINNSEIIVRNSGSLSAKGTIGPLYNFELNHATPTLDFGGKTNPVAPVCIVSNLLTAPPLTMNIAGGKLRPGTITLIKYASRAGKGAEDFTSLSLPPTAQGYLTNNAANSSIDLVLTQATPDTNNPSPPPMRHLEGPIYADYNWPIRESSKRGDGYSHFDTPRMIQRLIEGNMKTYAFLVKHQVTDWNDFRLEFLPAAQAAGLTVWLYLTPPSEVTPEPFRDDFITWAAEAGKLARQYPALTGFAIDDFVGTNLKDTFTPEYFSPEYVSRMVATAHQYSTNLMFLPVVYDSTISPAFANLYGPYCGGLIFPYINSTNKDDLAAEAPQIAYNCDVMNGKLAQFVVRFPSGRPSAAGDYAALTQVITNSAGFPDAPYLFNFRVSDDYNGATTGYHKLQLVVDGKVLWSGDVAGAMGVQDISTNLQTWIRGKTSIPIAVRFYEARGVGSFYSQGTFNVPGGDWSVSETGAFLGAGTYYPPHPGLNVPLVVMIYDQGYGGWNPTTNYMVEANRIAQGAVQAGQAVGIIQYKLDKAATSEAFPLIAQLYGQWAYQPRLTSIARLFNGNASLTGFGGGPNIGYTLQAADVVNAPPGSWSNIAGGAFSAAGNFTNTDMNTSGHVRRFYRITVP